MTRYRAVTWSRLIDSLSRASPPANQSTSAPHAPSGGPDPQSSSPSSSLNGNDGKEEAVMDATQIDDDHDSDYNDQLPLSWLFSRPIQSSLPTQSSSSSSPVVLTNIAEAPGVYSDRKARYYRKKSSFYQSIRARFAHPDDNIMCWYCGVRQHTGLHHEDEFERAATNIPAPIT